MFFANLPLGFTVDVLGKSKTAPVELPTRNLLDEHGNFLDLKRLPGERNDAYYRRLMSVFPLRASSTREGLVHGITRELGLEEAIGLRIMPAINGDGEWIPTAPRVEVSSTKITLYSTYYDEDNFVIDTEVDIFDHTDVYLLRHVVNKINYSPNFEAELGPHVTGNEIAAGLMGTDSQYLVTDARVPSSRQFFLEHADLVGGSIYFLEKEVFRRQVGTEGEVTEEGTFFVDPARGTVSVYSIPSGAGVARYYYRRFPLYVSWSPITVYSVRDEEYRDRLFETEVGGDNSPQRGVVSYEGSRVYRQIFDKSPCLWGR